VIRDDYLRGLSEEGSCGVRESKSSWKTFWSITCQDWGEQGIIVGRLMQQASNQHFVHLVNIEQWSVTLSQLVIVSSFTLPCLKSLFPSEEQSPKQVQAIVDQ